MKDRKNKKSLTSLLTLAAAFVSAQSAHAVYVGPAQPRGVESVPGEFLVRTRSQYGIRSLERTFATKGFVVKRELRNGSGLYLVKASGVSASSLMAESNEIESIEPNYIYRITMGSPKPTPTPTEPTPTEPPPSGTDYIPKDAMFGSLWGMRNYGQKDKAGRVGTVGADIKATKVWQTARGSRNVVVAVVDTGIDFSHPDLQANLWSMPGSPDVHGYNAIKGNNNATDDNGHGTHCAGTIGGVPDNNEGVAGVAPQVSLMGVKFLASDGSGTTADAIEGIDWAREHGADIISASWGGGGESKELENAIRRARDAGIVFVAAAGNEGANNDSSSSFPANYGTRLDNVISVAASNNRDAMSSFSNYGAKSVHLMAPGENILSTVKGKRYDTYSGTSMATPHVSGAVALLVAQQPSLTPAEVRAKLVSSVDKLGAYQSKVISGGRLNLEKLLAR